MNPAALVLQLCRAMASVPDRVRVFTAHGREATLLEVLCAPEDIGALIGYGGEVLDALRWMVHLVGLRDQGRLVYVNILGAKGSRVRNVMKMEQIVAIL